MTVEKVAAELMFEAIAKARRKADLTKSFEQHYADVLSDPAHRDVVELLS